MKKLIFPCLLPLLVAFIPLVSLSQWSTDPAVNNPINILSGEQAIPKIATCPNGDTYIASFSSESGNYNVRMQRLNAQGVPQWTTNGILISDNPQDSWLTDWDMTADNANHAILVFPDIRNGGANVVAYRISPTGTFVWGDDGIVLSTGDANYSPKVTTTSSGNAIIAWPQEDVIHMQKISPSGSLLWGSGGITLSETGYSYSWPQLLPVGTDEFIMKYFKDSGTFPAITRHVYAQRYNASGSPVWSSPTVVSNAGGITAWTQIFPFVNDGSDGFYIAWHDDRDNNMLASTWVNHISNSGAVLFPANGVEASTLGGRNHYYPQLDLPPGSSNVYVFWNEMDADQNNRGIYGQKLSSTGTRLWAASGMVFIEISPTDVYPEAVRNSPSDVVVFYSQQISGMNYTLKAFRVDTDGGYMWTPNHKTLCSVASQKVHVETNEFANNQWIMSWEDNRNGQSDIYAQNIQLDGSLGPYDPQEGTIEGMVNLVGGSASVTQVTVTAGEFTTNPDATGFYSMVVTQGTYQVIGNLSGYIPDTVNSVVVVTGQTTDDVNLTLQALPTGYITGNVTLSGGTGDVTEVEVVGGYHVVNPDSQGNSTMEIEIGTYDVTAGLAGYVPDTDSGIVVQEGMTTVGVDFILDPVPTTGFITGIVLLDGGAGDVTQVDVTAGNVTVNPGADGVYLLEIVAGTYEVTASLPGYLTGAVTGVVVEVEQTTPDVDFYLYQVPNAGYIQGTVTLVNGEGDVTQATVTAGGQSTHPSENGYYFLAVSAGTYTVKATHPYTLPDSLTNITVVAGQNTENVDFELEIVRGDLVVKALDDFGEFLNDVDIEITGPEGTLTGTITSDSLIFASLSYGEYNGTALYEDWAPHYAHDTLDNADNDMIFYFTTTGIKDDISQINVLEISPNPSSGNVSITFALKDEAEVSLKIYSQQGLLIRKLAEKKFDAGLNQIQWNGTDNQGTSCICRSLYGRDADFDRKVVENYNFEINKKGLQPLGTPTASWRLESAFQFKFGNHIELI
jgi:hypothetical protein